MNPQNDDGLILRPATSDDFAALSQLASEAFTFKFGHLYRHEDLSAFLSEALSEAAIRRDHADPQQLYQLAESGGRLLGFCKIAMKCSFPEHARGHHTMELKQLYTAPDATGKGIGAALMDWAMAEFAARGADEVQLSVYSENEGAQRFYARYGFAKVADVTFHVGEHIDPEFLFARLLSN